MAKGWALSTGNLPRGGLSRNSVDRITDRLDMTSAVHRGRKALTQQQQQQHKTDTFLSTNDQIYSFNLRLSAFTSAILNKTTFCVVALIRRCDLTLHENVNLRFFTNICKCKQLPLVIFAGNLWTPEHEWNYRISLSIRNATPKDLQMQGIYFHIFEQIMSSSEIYHLFDVSLSTYFFLETYKFDHLFAIMHKDSLLPRFTMKNGFWKTL